MFWKDSSAAFGNPSFQAFSVGKRKYGKVQKQGCKGRRYESKIVYVTY